MRAAWLDDDRMGLILTAMMPDNRLAMMVSIATGLRISDVLHMRPADLRTQRPTITERKTGKRRRVYLPNRIYELLQERCGRYYVFPGRLRPDKPRTRQAVYKDLRRVARLYRINGAPIKEHISPHTGRKMYAVHDYHDHGDDLRRVQHDMLHTDPAVTALYALSDRLPVHKMCSLTRKKKRRRSHNA
jgi:integrase